MICLSNGRAARFDGLQVILLSGTSQDGATLSCVQARGGMAAVQTPAVSTISTRSEAALALMQPNHFLAPRPIAELHVQLPLGRPL